MIQCPRSQILREKKGTKTGGTAFNEFWPDLNDEFNPSNFPLNEAVIFVIHMEAKK